MKFLKQLTHQKAFTGFVLLVALLWGFPASANILDSSGSESLVKLKVEVEADGSHNNLKPYVPAQNRNAEPQAETEIRAEEEDTTQKDNGEAAFGLLYEFNSTWVKVSACSGRALLRIAGTNALYILHHSWKSFLI
ncbi:MAG TPA: hypothetical protein DHV26_16395 [Cytophagales bacterium]|nr:hypothetical protein [Cytophagales bacterium]HRG08609.1 hypothetical protein [Cyclobacteriaceae bacterium]